MAKIKKRDGSQSREEILGKIGRQFKKDADKKETLNKKPEPGIYKNVIRLGEEILKGEMGKTLEVKLGSKVLKGTLQSWEIELPGSPGLCTGGPGSLILEVILEEEDKND